MIFVATGTQEPFDRLIQTIDRLAPTLATDRVVAQICHSQYKARYVECHDFLPPSQFDALFMEAELVVAHAGMGTILSALAKDKPLLIMPRLARFGEHRNDHQLATARAFEKLRYVHVAYDEAQLEEMLVNLLANKAGQLHQIAPHATGELVEELRSLANEVAARK
jgi:UDP-N-acetylglucosamine transferase subunit ALG13